MERTLVPNADEDEIVPPFNGYAKGADIRVSKQGVILEWGAHILVHGELTDLYRRSLT